MRWTKNLLKQNLVVIGVQTNRQSFYLFKSVHNLACQFILLFRFSRLSVSIELPKKMYWSSGNIYTPISQSIDQSLSFVLWVVCMSDFCWFVGLLVNCSISTPLCHLENCDYSLQRGPFILIFYFTVKFYWNLEGNFRWTSSQVSNKEASHQNNESTTMIYKLSLWFENAN